MKILVNHKNYLDLPAGSTARDAAEKLHLNAPDQAIAAKINGQTKDLTSLLQDGDELELLGFDDPAGKEIFWHTSAHVLAQAMLRLWPNAKPTIGPPIENGFYYDFADLAISDQDFARIEKEVEAVIAENLKPIRIEFSSKKQAKESFSSNPYKCELIEGFEETPISAYRQGEFFDLCRGPHLASLNKIKAFKVLKTSGAYWRGDSSREMLTRIYAISFPDKKRLKEYLDFLEEAKKRDHKVLGPALDLFSFKEEAPGMPFIHPHGLIVWNRLLEFLRQLLQESRLHRNQNSDDDEQRALGKIRALVPLQRKHVPVANRRSRICDQTDELPGVHALLPLRLSQLSGAADAGRGNRPRPPL